MNKLKSIYSNLVNRIYLLTEYKKYYIKYYFKNKKTIYKTLKKHGLFEITPVHKDIWKLWYNTSYYQGVIGNKKVFIKVMGELLQDCYDNEILVNKYIDDNSSWLKGRKPKLIDSFEVDDLYILVYENLPLRDIVITESTTEDIKKAIIEFNKIGILHTDFGLSNIASFENKVMFIDYGTSLCPKSNFIRIRNGENYNHINNIIPTAKRICEDANFYYDDATHIGINNFGERTNFLVGNGKVFYARLGSNLFKYKLKYNGDVYLLEKNI